MCLLLPGPRRAPCSAPKGVGTLPRVVPSEGVGICPDPSPWLADGCLLSVSSHHLSVCLPVSKLPPCIRTSVTLGSKDISHTEVTFMTSR